MNVLFLDQYGDVGGAQSCLLDLLPGVLDCGWDPCVAAPGEGPLEHRVRALGIAFEPILCGPFPSGRKTLADGLRFGRQAPTLALGLRRLASQMPADLVYVNGPRLLPAAVASPAPVLFHCHSRVAGTGARALMRGALAMTRATLVGSCRYVLEPLPGPARVVYNATALSTHSPCPHEGFNIGVIGRLGPEKGQREFVAAAREVLRRRPECRFVVAGAALFGDPEAARYAAEVQALAEGLPIEFTGWRDDVYAVLAGLDLLVVPSTAAEATTRVILEAFAARVPVLASATGGIPEVVQDDVTGWLTPPGDAAALVERLAQAPADRACLRRMADRAHAEWRDRFTLDRYRRELLSIMLQAARTR